MIRAGIVGAGGWAGVSHLPALAGLAGFEVTAVATTRQASADQAAAAHGVPLAFADAGTLAAHPDVDLVVVSVKAAGHAKVIRAALEAGKHVLSEWPLGVDAAEADDLARAAGAAGVVHAVNLQGYQSPDARYVADLLAAGAIGRLESAVLVAAGDPLGGARIAPELAWSTDPAGGTSLLTVMAGHFLATLDRMAGSLVEVSARLPRPYDHVDVAGTGRTVPNGVPAQVLLHGVLENGATASVAVHGGSGTPDGFFVKLVGAEGMLTVTPARPGMYMHWTDWDIKVDGEPVKVPDDYRTVPFDPAAGPVANVAAVYEEIARSIAEGRRPRPDFHAAAAHHRVLAAIERSAETGTAQKVG
ncbi:Gfo/Idh/MocA family protein [Streptomyces cinerochromogenes]|uniref:Gfo/Idh/MocA family protein n=1 Tax=Streptomyces cinerochromogenes TaxID=66422 RepID=UPI0016708CA2|nr:Gfo/Idh/MocA family oxidoreductase [Streptomyces cinerochromogenes]GGS54499.1 oxidoreductase [Streptomyces cinerochromogenes]